MSLRLGACAAVLPLGAYQGYQLRLCGGTEHAALSLSVARVVQVALVPLAAMTEFKKLVLQKYAQVAERETPEGVCGLCVACDLWSATCAPCFPWPTCLCGHKCHAAFHGLAVPSPRAVAVVQLASGASSKFQCCKCRYVVFDCV